MSVLVLCCLASLGHEIRTLPLKQRSKDITICDSKIVILCDQHLISLRACILNGLVSSYLAIANRLKL